MDRDVRMNLPKPNPGATTVIVGAVAAGVLFYLALMKTGGVQVPATPFTEGLYTTPDQDVPGHSYNDGLGLTSDALLYTKHRYPARCGGELSTAIHFGHSRLMVPHERDLNWIVCPPSEVTI